MNKVIFLLLTSCSFTVSAKFINPLEFDGSRNQQKDVISYIKDRVKKDYCETIDMCQEVTLRLMETENLDSFKRLTKATNSKVLNRVIHDYCVSIDMCTYQMIEMMYNENVKAENQELIW